MTSNKKFRHVSAAFRKGGIGRLRKEVAAYRRRQNEREKYRKFLIREKAKFDSTDFPKLISEMKHQPLISVIVPVYNVDEKWLRLCLDSVQQQLYSNWQLCIADDHSELPRVRKVLEEYSRQDARILVTFRDTNGHISAASNSALDLATGEFCVLLDHDDELAKDALFWLANEINEHPEAKMIFSDEDLIDEKGRRYEPKFKPDFSRDLFYSMNMITHLSAYQTDLLKRIGGFREGFEGSQDYDVALRVIENIKESEIRHIPRILYHWRAIATSVAFSGEAKPYAYVKAREALAEHFERLNITAEVCSAVSNLNRIRYEVKESFSVSLILVGDKQPEIEFDPNIEIIDCKKFNAIALNEAADEATNDILCFYDASLLVNSDEWLSELVSFVQRPEIGAVGGKIIASDGTIVHSGYILNKENLISNAHEGFLFDDVGYFFRAGLIGNFSAVSARCFAIRREVFISVDGFDAVKFPTKYFDVDLCLKLREKGLRVVYTPYAEFVESRTIKMTGDANQEANFEKKWDAVLCCDPFYNPNLSQRQIFSIKT